ncbi:MAG: hypothetical protein AAB405_01940 [Patescibacteria group bacterium]
MASLKIKTFVIINLVSLLLLPVMVSAISQGSSDVDFKGEVQVGTMTELLNKITGVIKWIYTIFFILAGIFILAAAFTYLTAQGDPEKVGKAKSQIIYAIVAIVVALIALSIPAIVKSVF